MTRYIIAFIDISRGNAPPKRVKIFSDPHEKLGVSGMWPPFCEAPMNLYVTFCDGYED